MELHLFEGNINIYWILIAFSFLIILSFVFNLISKKTSIPSVIMLILTGYVVGKFTSIQDDSLKPILEFLGTAGLIMIVLEASLDIRLKPEKLIMIRNAFLLALISLIITSVAIAFIFTYYYDVSFRNALVYGIPLSILSSAIIIPSVGNLKGLKREFLIFEGAFSDILGIMIYYFLMDSFDLKTASEITFHIIGNLFITFLLAIILSFTLILAIQRIESNVKLFLPIAILGLLYGVGKLFHLSSLIFVIAFGLIINNRDIFFRGRFQKWVIPKAFDRILSDIKMLTVETSFLIRTFFFIVFGMSISVSGMFDSSVLIISGLIMLVIYLIRFGGVMAFHRVHLAPAIFVAPRGLITILLYYGIPEQYRIVEFKPSILLLVIILTNVIMMIGLIASSNKDLTRSNRPEWKKALSNPLEYLRNKSNLN